MPPVGYDCIRGWCTDKNVEDAVFPYVKCRLRPNTWTIINLVAIVPLLLFLLYRKQSTAVWIGFVVLVCLNRTLDIVDGAVARKCNMKSKTGAILDIFTDTVLAIGVFVTALVVSYRSNGHLNSPLIFAALMTVLASNALSHIMQIAKEASDARGRKLYTLESLIADNSLYVFIALMVSVKLIVEHKLR